MATEKEYARQLRALLPKGPAWPDDEDLKLFKLLEALGLEFSTLEASMRAFVNDFFPDTTSAFLSDWERVLGLPWLCDDLADTVALRRKDVLTKLTAQGGQRPQDYIDLAAVLGYTITITEFDTFKVNRNKIGDPLNGEDWQYAWQVNAPLDTIEPFKVNKNSIGDPLRSWGNERLECWLNGLKPAHTTLIFSYS